MRVSAAMATFRAGSRFEPWARKIATNVAISILRRRRMRTGLEFTVGEGPASSAPDPAELLVRAEQAHSIRRAVKGLPARYRRVVELRLFGGLEHAEIARLLRLSQAAVRVLFSRGIRNVRSALKGSDARSS